MAKNKALDDSALSKAAGGAHLEGNKADNYQKLVSDVGDHRTLVRILKDDANKGMGQTINTAMGGGRLSKPVYNDFKGSGVEGVVDFSELEPKKD